MRLAPGIANDLVDDLAVLLDGGRLEIADNAAMLAVLFFQTPAFLMAENGAAMALPLDPTIIFASGTADRAVIMTAGGMIVADLTVAAEGTPEAKDADVLFDRLDFQRGGTIEISSIRLRLPMRA